MRDSILCLKAKLLFDGIFSTITAEIFRRLERHLIVRWDKDKLPRGRMGTPSFCHPLFRKVSKIRENHILISANGIAHNAKNGIQYSGCFNLRALSLQSHLFY